MAWNVSLMLHYFHLEGRSEMRLEYPMSSWAELERARIVYENARECVFTRTVCFRAGFRHIQVTTVPESGVVKLFELISNKRFWYVDADNPTLQKSSLLGDLWHSPRIENGENCHRYFHSHSYLTHKIKQINDALSLCRANRAWNEPEALK